MTKISSNSFKPGMTIIIKNAVWRLIKVVHVNPGRGSAFVRTRIKNLKDQSVIERTFRAGEKVPQAIITDHKMQYLYKGSAGYVFMDSKTYEQVTVPGANIKSALKYLKPNLPVTLFEFNGTILGVKLPNTVTLTVKQTQPTIKGNTASGGSKPATMNTGLVVQVPFFVTNGQKLVINTQDGTYVSRA
ncbi:MAG: elongation factor P [Acetilactobacillus jinshanensis]